MTQLCERIHGALGHALVALLTLMTLTVGWQVASRLLARLALATGTTPLVEPSRWTEELAGFQLAWVALLGAAYALRRGEHLGFDLFYLRLGPAGRRVLDALVPSLVALFAAVVLCWGGTRLVLMTHQLGQQTPALGWPMAAVYAVLPVTGALFVLFAVEALVHGPREQEPR